VNKKESSGFEKLVTIACNKKKKLTTTIYYIFELNNFINQKKLNNTKRHILIKDFYQAKEAFFEKKFSCLDIFSLFFLKSNNSNKKQKAEK